MFLKGLLTYTRTFLMDHQSTTLTSKEMAFLVRERPLDGVRKKSHNMRKQLQSFFGRLRFRCLARWRNLGPRLLDALARFKIQLVFGGQCSCMQIDPLLLKSPLFCFFSRGHRRERDPRKTPVVVREALEQQGPD